MSKISCACGHIIVDQTDSAPHKGSLLPDTSHGLFFDWVAEETQSYLEAVQESDVKRWLLNRGYSECYVDLRLSHGEVMHDHIHARYHRLTKDFYQCVKCQRLLIQHERTERFTSYLPEG